MNDDHLQITHPRRRALLRGAMVGALLVGVSGGAVLAQSSAGMEVFSGGEGSQLRPSLDQPTINDIQRPSISTDEVSSEASRSLYEPFGRGSEDSADRIENDALEASEPEAPVVVQKKLDLFEGPDDGRSGPENLAAAPAAPGGAENVSRTAATARTGTRDAASDPLLAARDGGLPDPDLAVGLGPIRSGGVDAVLGRQNLAVTALRGPIPIAEDDPFAPVGIRLGSSVLYSTLEQSVGVSSNLSDSVGGKSGAFSETTLSERLLSDWSEHSLEVNALASYRRNFAGELKSDPRIAVDGRLQLDLDALTTATLRGAIEYRQEDPIDLNSSASVSDRPDVVTASTGLELARQFGRTDVSLDGSILRQDTSSSQSPEGFEIPEEVYTTYTAALRTGYEISPAIKPFAEASTGFRVFEETAGSENRDSIIQSLRGGLGFDFGEKLLGEVAAGYAWNIPDSEALATTAAPVFDTRIAWSPQRGTDLVWTTGTTFDPDTDGAGTSVLYRSALALRHRLTHRTDLNAQLSASYRDSDVEADVETSYAAEVGFTYWLNRTLAFTGLLSHEALDSKTEGGDYTAETARIGLRLQR